MEPHLYNVDISWTKERHGEMSSPELPTVIEIATPPQFPNGVEGIWSPEHLFTSAVARDNIFATQFHPEKSAEYGLKLYKNFVSWQP